MKLSSSFLSSVAVIVSTLSYNTLNVVGDNATPGDATSYCDGVWTELGWSGVKAGDACTKTGATCMVSASPTEVTDQMVECNGTTMTFVPFTGTVGEAFVTPPSTTAGGTAADSALGPAEIDASITSSSLAKGETDAEADDMSNVVSGGDMTAMSTAEGSSGTTNTYVSTVAAAATVAIVGVVALL